MKGPRQLTFNELSSTRLGIDYNLELRCESPIVSEENYLVIYFCLVALPNYKEEGLLNENHGMGYHIHYLVIQNKRQTRTNIVFFLQPYRDIYFPE
jgi:hypothetical protein